MATILARLWEGFVLNFNLFGLTLLFALPGSRRAALENLDAVLEALPHALEKLGGDMSDCGRA